MASKSKAKAKQASKKPAKAAVVKPAPKPKRTITVAGQPTRFIREIKVGARHRKDMGDLIGLAKSIDERGALLQPVVIDKDNTLIAGQRRMAAWPLTKFRREPIPVTVVDIDAIVAGEWDENAKRKDFTPSEKDAIARALEPIVAARAKERMAKGKKIEGGEKGNTADLVAAYVGADRKTIQRTREVIEAAARDPEKFGSLVEQMDKSDNVNGPWRRLQVHNQVADINTRKKNGTLAVPEGKFDRIVADMPWPYEADDDTPAERGRAVRGYATMSIKEMKALPIAERCADSTVLYFWVTNFHMEYAYQVMRAWGFDQFPTILTWAKDKFGKGQRLRCATEHCLIAIKGKPVWNLTNETTRLDGPVREDSRKPDEFYTLIDAITPAERSLELFARRELPEGWVGFGDQVGKLKDDASSPGQGQSTPPAADYPGDDEHQSEITELQALETIEAGREIDINLPIVASLKEQKLVRGSVKLKLTKAGMKRLEALRKEEYSKSDDPPGADRADDDQVQEENISQADCRVCSAGDGICAQCMAAADHVITMGVDGGGEEVRSAALCSCGWSNEIVCDDCTSQTQQTAIRAHWQNVVTEANAAAASVEQSPSREPAFEMPDLPECLRRAPAEAAE